MEYWEFSEEAAVCPLARFVRFFWWFGEGGIVDIHYHLSMFRHSDVHSIVHNIKFDALLHGFFFFKYRIQMHANEKKLPFLYNFAKNIHADLYFVYLTSGAGTVGLPYHLYHRPCRCTITSNLNHPLFCFSSFFRFNTLVTIIFVNLDFNPSNSSVFPSTPKSLDRIFSEP